METGSGMGAGTAVGIGVAALLGVGLLWTASRNNAGYDGCRHGGVDPYLLGENNGQVKAGIACNASAIARIENTLSQMQQTSAMTCAVNNAVTAAQNDTNAGLASISTNVGRLHDSVNRALGNCFVWSRDVCNPCGCSTSTTTSSNNA